MVYVYERRSEDGTLFFVVKFGLEVVAVIMPCDSIIGKNLADKLKTISELTNVRVENMIKNGGNK